jgi:hypothetical protein
MPPKPTSFLLQQRTDATVAEQRERVAHYGKLAKEATTETMRKRLLELARQCAIGKGPEEG